MDVDTRIKYNSVTFVFGVFLLFNLQYGQVASKNNQTSTPLSIVTILDPPYVMKDPDTGKFAGFMIDILTEAGIPVDHIDTHVHDEYGWEQEPGEFNGMLGDLVNGKYDLAAAPYNIRSNTAKFVTFTQPVLHHGYMVLYKIPKDNEWNFDLDQKVTLLKPFNPSLWVLIVLASVLASITLLLIGRFSPYENDVIASDSQRADNSLTTVSWGSGLMYVLGSLTGRHVGVTPRSTSGRILTVVWWIFSLMTVGAYIAGLVVVLYRASPHLRTVPFGSVQEMLSQTDVKLLGIKNSATYNYVANQQGQFESKIYQYWKHNWDTVMVDTLEEAMTMLNEGDGKYAVFMGETRADYLASQEPCDKMVIGNPVGDLRMGFACSKGSTVCENIDHVILRLQEEGKMEQLREKYFWSGCHMSSEIFFEGNAFFDRFGRKDPGHLSPHSITVHRFSAAFIVMAIGFVTALLVLVAEVVYSKRKGNSHHQFKAIVKDDESRSHVIQDGDFSPDA